MEWGQINFTFPSANITSTYYRELLYPHENIFLLIHKILKIVQNATFYYLCMQSTFYGLKDLSIQYVHELCVVKVNFKFIVMHINLNLVLMEHLRCKTITSLTLIATKCV